MNVWLPLTCSPLGTWPATQACVLTGNRTSDSLLYRLALNPLSHTSQGSKGPHLIQYMHFLLSRRLALTFEKEHPLIVGVGTWWAERKKNISPHILGRP